MDLTSQFTKNLNLIQLDGSIGNKEKWKSIDHFNKFPTNIITIHQYTILSQQTILTKIYKLEKKKKKLWTEKEKEVGKRKFKYSHHSSNFPRLCLAFHPKAFDPLFTFSLALKEIRVQPSLSSDLALSLALISISLYLCTYICF